MAVRIATLGVPLFRVHDLEVNERWLAVKEVTDKQRASLVAHVGRYVQVHPEDVTKLGELGLAAGEDGTVVEAKKSNPKTDGPKADAGKAGAKKES